MGSRMLPDLDRIAPLNENRVRDAKELAKLPEAEQESWQKLWADVDRLLKAATAAFTETNLKGKLTAKDTEQMHEMKMTAGNTYVIDMTSSDFDTYLRLETAQKKVLAKNDDIAPHNLNSRILFTPKEDGLYRIIATSFGQEGAGAYALRIRDVGREALVRQQRHSHVIEAVVADQVPGLCHRSSAIRVRLDPAALEEERSTDSVRGECLEDPVLDAGSGGPTAELRVEGERDPLGHVAATSPRR